MALSVDVVLPVHGGERWVEEAVRSVLAQTWAHWRLTVVDDASPDASAERVEALRREHPDRIDLVRLDRPRRAAGARMLAVERTSADLVAFLDQDDRWLPAKLERQVARLEAEPELAAVHTDIEVIDARGEPVPGAADRENAGRAAVAWGAGAALATELFRSNRIRLATACVRRSAFLEVGGFDTTLFGGEDWEFWVRLALHHPIAHLPEVLCQRRVHGGNVSRVHARERARGKLRALEKMERDHPFLAPHVSDKRAALRAAAAGPLALCQELFARLDRAGVRWCHWKSNEHAAAALAGRTDLDLLVDPAGREPLEAVLAELDFKRVLSPPERRFPGMSDRLGMDPDTGALVHLHLHEQLVLGRPGAKNHRLPLEPLVLSDLREVEGVKAPSAELELLLLLVRAPLKVSPWRLVRRWRRDGTKTLPSSLVREIDFLAADLDPERFRSVVAKTGLALDPETLLELVWAVRARRLTTPTLARHRVRVLRALRPHRRGPGWRAALRTLRARILGSRAARRWLGPRAKTLPHPGPIVALVGADGAGKSRLARDLCAWLGWKLRVEPVYLGIPKGARAYRALQWLRRRWGGSWLEGERWLLVARHRAAERRRAERVAARGGVAIADRYPLPALWVPPEPMDGPRLAGHGMAARERALYRRIPPPTRVFALRAPLEVLRARKDDVDPALHARKAAAVDALQPSELVRPVDASRPYPEVLLELKRAIWELL